MLQREWGAESNGKLLNLFIPGKTVALVQSILTYGVDVWQIPTREIKKKLSTQMDVLRRSAENLEWIKYEIKK